MAGSGGSLPANFRGDMNQVNGPGGDQAINILKIDIYIHKFGRSAVSGQPLTHFIYRVEYRLMFRDKASILMEARAKRQPNLSTKVVGFGHAAVKQKAMKMIRETPV